MQDGGWGPQHIESMQSVKKMLMNLLIRVLPVKAKEFVPCEIEIAAVSAGN